MKHKPLLNRWEDKRGPNIPNNTGLIISLFCALSVFFCVSARSRISYHTGEVMDGYDFILYSPDSIVTAKPLIITLHSRNAVGNNLQDVDTFGTIDAIESGMKIDAYVVAPQASEPYWNVDKVMKVVDYVAANNNVDYNRIYAIGMSMGGNGVAELSAAHPSEIAAAIIIAGSLRKGDASELSKIPLWVIRGLDDRKDAIERTDEMVERIRMFDSSRLVYTKVKGLNHRQHERILYMPCFYEWLMSHSLKDLNRPVNSTVVVTAKMLQHCYEGLKLRDNSAAR